MIEVRAVFQLLAAGHDCGSKGQAGGELTFTAIGVRQYFVYIQGGEGGFGHFFLGGDVFFYFSNFEDLPSVEIALAGLFNGVGQIPEKTESCLALGVLLQLIFIGCE